MASSRVPESPCKEDESNKLAAPLVAKQQTTVPLVTKQKQTGAILCSVAAAKTSLPSESSVSVTLPTSMSEAASGIATVLPKRPYELPVVSAYAPTTTTELQPFAATLPVVETTATPSNVRVHAPSVAMVATSMSHIQSDQINVPPATSVAYTGPLITTEPLSNEPRSSGVIADRAFSPEAASAGLSTTSSSTISPQMPADCGSNIPPYVAASYPTPVPMTSVVPISVTSHSVPVTTFSVKSVSRPVSVSSSVPLVSDVTTGTVTFASASLATYVMGPTSSTLAGECRPYMVQVLADSHVTAPARPVDVSSLQGPQPRNDFNTKDIDFLVRYGEVVCS